jgi:hypothetical protein
LLPPLKSNEPALTVVPPVYVFTELNVNAPVPDFTNPCVPASTTLTLPLWATNAVPVAVNVPFWTVPPANVTVPLVLWLDTPRSNTPPAAVIAPLSDNRSLPPLKSNEPALTVVPPVYVFTPLKVNAPVPDLTNPCVPPSTALTLPL